MSASASNSSATSRGCPRSRRALRRQAHSRDVGSASEAWLMGRFALLETNRQIAVRGFASPLDHAPDGATLVENSSMGPATSRGCPRSRRALRRQAHSRDVGSASEAWLMGRFALLETNRQGAVRGFALPLDYAPDGATLEASGGGARPRRAVPPTEWPARAGFPLEASGGGARPRRAVPPTKWPARAGFPLEASGGGARLRRAVPPTKWPARAGFPLEVNGGGSPFMSLRKGEA